MRSDLEVTAHIHRSSDGDLHHEYIANGVAYPSITALERALEGQ
ncbi:hypothetical protein [Natrinema sp. CBA1119]|nr:hypothetical protein [Natrinema sp. CBA1119]